MSDPHDHLRADPNLEPVVAAHGKLTLDVAEDMFTRLVTAILRQQVSMASAAATRERLFDAVGPYSGDDRLVPEDVLATEESVLRDAGLSRQKTRYVRNVAEAFQKEGYDREYFAGVDDETVRDELTAITGVGDWTAEMMLMFALGREDVFPVGDLGIRKGMTNIFPELDREDRDAMVEQSEAWRPYRSYASLYLWRVQDGLPDTD